MRLRILPPYPRDPLALGHVKPGAIVRTEGGHLWLRMADRPPRPDEDGFITAASVAYAARFAAVMYLGADALCVDPEAYQEGRGIEHSLPSCTTVVIPEKLAVTQ